MESSPIETDSKSPHTSAHHYGALQPLLDDESVEEIWINSPQRIYVARRGRSELTNLVLTKSQLQSIMDRILMWSGRRIDLSHPFVDARLPDGSRLHITIPEITAEHWAINIRKHLMRGKSLHELCAMGVMSEEILGFLGESIRNRSNILVSGATQAGKTTVLNALVSSIAPTERVITIEEVFELKPRLPDCVAMQTRSANLDGIGEISIRRLIKEALRMRPSRLVIGEIREAESLDLLIALNSGIPGMATIHANSARDAIRKLQTLPLLAGENITQDFLTPTVYSAIDYVIHVGLDNSGTRRVLEVARVNNRSENTFIEIEHEYLWDGDSYRRGPLI
jgi:pilus assembly protein CpaF